jgi:hypothetical protein
MNEASPVALSVTNVMPVGASSFTMWVVSTPLSSSCVASALPSLSSPTAPTALTFTPSRASVAATLAEAPPSSRRNTRAIGSLSAFGSAS